MLYEVITSSEIPDQAHDDRHQDGGEQAVQPHSQPGEGAGFLADLKGTGGSNTVRSDANRKPAHAEIPDAQRVKHILRHDGTADAG